MSKRIGALWAPKKKDSQAKLNGFLDVVGIPVRISIFLNNDQNKKDTSPAYHIVSFGIDSTVPRGDTGQDNAQQTTEPPDDGMPF